MSQWALLYGDNIWQMRASLTFEADQPITANLSILAIIAAGLAVYGVSLGSSFHLDDYTLFSDVGILSPSGWWRVWRPLQTRPLTYFTFWLNYQLGGRNPIGYHFVNLTLHMLVLSLLYPILVRLLGSKGAWIGVSLFALHPIQTEAVVYVFERATLLATMFCVLTLRSWLTKRYWAAAGWFTMALLSKEECVTFPVFLLFFRQAVLPAAGMLCLSIAAGCRVFLALKVLHIAGAGAGAGISALDYFRTQGTVILRYLRLLLIPYGFTCDPDIAIVHGWCGWLSWAVLLIVAAALWKQTRWGKWFAAGLILLSPSSTIFAAQDLAADRRMYLPMLAFVALGGLILRRVDGRVMAAIVFSLAILTFTRALVWHNEQALWAEAVRRAPKKLRPRILLSRASGIDEAMRILDDAKKIAPDDPRPAIEEGLRFLAANRPASALAEFDYALALAPDDPMSLNDRGSTFLKLGRQDAAMDDFRHALRVSPCWASARRNLELLGVTPPADCK